jgi:hypothetical protein
VRLEQQNAQEDALAVERSGGGAGGGHRSTLA